MSSRALRRAQQQKELLELQKKQELEPENSRDDEDNEDEDEDEDDGDEDETASSPAFRPAAVPVSFALLGDYGENDHESDGDEAGEDDGVNALDTSETHAPTAPGPPSSTPNRNKKKKKRKAKSSGKDHKHIENPPDPSLDEIDIALQNLSASDKTQTPYAAEQPIDESTAHLCSLLSIDSQHLHVENEMKRLFGRAALHIERETDDNPRAGPRRAEQVTLADAVSGKYASGGPGIPEVIRRRSLFVRGKEEWPKATGSGLGMEVVERRAGGVTEYRFVHNQQYQASQREFESCVQMMDPSLLVEMLRYNPYHVSTLLQVSDIAKQEKDYTTAGELLERALFSFGRALHSSFASAMAQGKARLDFRRPENREFFLASWRYIGNIGMRATWRTAFEWAKLTLMLSPEDDPYQMCLMLDQLALRARQSDTLIALYNTDCFTRTWQHLPNMAFSLCLARRTNAKNPTSTESAQAELRRAISQYPFIAARLMQALSHDTLPPAVWGKTAPSGPLELYTELYAALASDLWKPPETLKFLVDAAKSLSSLENRTDAVASDNEQSLTVPPITLNTARFVYLTDRPPLISLVPRDLISQIEDSPPTDPLPPADSISSYTSTLPRNEPNSNGDTTWNDTSVADYTALLRSDPTEFFRRWEALRHTFQPTIDAMLAGNAQPGAENGGADRGLTPGMVAQHLRALNLTTPQLRHRITLLDRMRAVLDSMDDAQIMSIEDPLLRNAFVSQRALLRGHAVDPERVQLLDAGASEASEAARESARIPGAYVEDAEDDDDDNGR